MVMTLRAPQTVKNGATRRKKIGYGALIGIGVFGGLLSIGWGQYQWCEANPFATAECVAQWQRKEADRALAAQLWAENERLQARLRESNRCAMYSWFGWVKIRDELPPGCSEQR